MLPELAIDLDIKKVLFPVMGFPKLDGVRLLNFDNQATGRSLKPHANIYTTQRFSDPIYKGFDGEATLGSATSSSLCRDTSSALSTITGEPDIVWNVFDYLTEDTVKLPYLSRIGALHSYIEKYNPKDVMIIEYTPIHTPVQLMDFYHSCLELGFEGAIYRDPLGFHKDGRSTVNEGSYLRLKPFSDKDAVVLEIIEAQQNLNEKKKNALGLTERSSHKENKIGKGMVGTLICRDILTNKIVNIGPGKMTHEERIYYFNSPDKLINEIIKYRSVDTGIKDAPRFGRYICRRSREDTSE
jgi:DNA ligase-1